MDDSQHNDPHSADELTNPYAAPTEVVDSDVDSALDDQYTSEMRAFIGSRADYFFRRWEFGKGFNWGAFFFSALYFCYRKMYRFAALVIGLQILVGIAEEAIYYLAMGSEMPESLGSITGLLVNLFIGSRATFWYRSHAERKIRELPAETDRETRLRVLAQKGGTSLLSPILLLLLCIGIVVAAVFALESTFVHDPYVEFE